MKVLDIITETTDPVDVPPALTRFEKNTVAANKYAEEWKKGINGKVYGLLTVLGIAAAAVQFGSHMMALQKMAGLSDEEFRKYVPDLRADQSPDQWVKEVRGKLWATFTIQILIPVIVRITKNLPIITELLAIAAGGAGAVFGRSGAGFVMGVKFVEKAAMTAFMVWLGTEAGSKWIADTVFFQWIMTPLGIAEANLWDKLYEKFFEVTTGKKPEPTNIDKRIEKANGGPDPVRYTSAELRQMEKDTDAAITPSSGVNPAAGRAPKASDAIRGFNNYSTSPGFKNY